MRILLKISLAVLAAGFLVVSGSAFAQEMAKPTMTITGDIGAGFGIFSADKQVQAPATGTQPAAQKAFSEWFTSYESNLRFTWQTDQFTVIGRLRTRANTEGSAGSAGTVSGGSTLAGGTVFGSNADDFYTEAWWTPGAFKLGVGKFQGQAWSQPFSGAYVILSPIESLTAGPNEYWMNWTGIPGLDAEYNLGAFQVGLALSSVCRPSCNVAQANSSTTGTTYSGTQSMTPHVAGTFGNISFRAQFPQTQALIANNAATKPLNNGTGGDPGETKTATGSGYQAGVGVDLGGGLAVGFDLSGFTDTKITDLGQAKDRTRSSYQVKVDAPVGPGKVTVAYFSIDDNNSAGGTDTYGGYAAAGTGSSNTYTSTKTTLRYTYPVSFGAIIPEYVAATEGGGVADPNKSKDKDLNLSQVRVILRATF
jgi:hypothetical protein